MKNLWRNIGYRMSKRNSSRDSLASGFGRGIGRSIARRSVAIMMIVTMMMTVAGCGSSSSSSTITPGSSITPYLKTSSTEAATTSTKNVTLTGVLTYVDTDSLLMKFVDVEQSAEYEIYYSGGTDIRDKYDKILAASTMELGGIYDVQCDKNGKATTITESSDYWEKSGITNLGVDESSRKLTYGSNEFSYDSSAVVMSGEDSISIAEIVSQDSVTLRGKDNRVYSIYVDTGHGYLELTGVDAFVGGYVSIGDKQFLGVTDDMLATVQEGTYKIEMQKGDVISSKTVKIVKNETSTLDFSDTAVEPTQMGQINFSVEPSDAVMSIDGTEVDFSSPISLTYGSHTVSLSAHYYETYTETIYVYSEYRTVIIDMTATSSSTTSSSTTTSTTSSTTSTTSVTSGYVVNVTTPEGASLYVDSVYIGIIPCSFDKESGSKTVTLAQSGYETVSYTISIANATGNLDYAFPDLVEDSD